jgi:hypothetical protein
MPETPFHTIRCDDELWAAARDKARAEGTTLTAVIVLALTAYTVTAPRR